MTISGARNSENGPETDVMVQFLAPETDVMGERNFMEKTNKESVDWDRSISPSLWISI
jgi:hypothetical protein